MKKLSLCLMLLLAIVIPSFSVISFSSAEDVRHVTDKDFLIYLGSDSETGTKFWRYSRDPADPCWEGAGVYEMQLIGEVPKKVFLLDDKAAQSLIAKGIQIATSVCNERISKALPMTFEITLTPDDCQMKAWGFGTLSGDLRVEPELVHAKWDCKESKMLSYTNFALEEKQAKLEEEARKAKQEAYEKEQARLEEEARKANEEALKAAEDKNRSRREAAEKLFDEFSHKYGVEVWPNITELFANPFVYEGKCIGLASRFRQMTSATQGIFQTGLVQGVVVSGIPKGFFRAEADVLLAGRVLGTMEGVPHLKFIGAYFCKREDNCEEMGETIRGRESGGKPVQKLAREPRETKEGAPQGTKALLKPRSRKEIDDYLGKSEYAPTLARLDRDAIARFLVNNPKLRLAASIDNRESNRGFPVQDKDYRPYFLKADFTGDGSKDMAVCFVDEAVTPGIRDKQGHSRGQFVIVVFNRSSKGYSKPFVIEKEFPLEEGGLFYQTKSDGRGPSLLVQEKFETGAALCYQWKTDKYVMEETEGE